MTEFSYFVFGTGVLFELLLLYRLLRTGLLRIYPYFSLYVIYVVLVQSFLLFGLLELAPTVYAEWYWGSSSVSIGLRFLVVWEVFRHLFPASSSLRGVVFGRRAMILLALTLLASTVWGVQSYGQTHSVFLAMERSFGFAQAALIMAILAVARYYDVRMGRNAWGMAVAFGMYISLSTANAALVDLFNMFVPYWQLVSPISLVLMLAMWTWAMWVYAPNPSAAGAEGSRSRELHQWSQQWDETLSAVRKVIHS